MSYSGEMNDAGDGDDEKADDEGGNSDIESAPAQPPRPVIVTLIIAVPRLRIRNNFYNKYNTFSFKGALCSFFCCKQTKRQLLIQEIVV